MSVELTILLMLILVVYTLILIVTISALVNISHSYLIKPALMSAMFIIFPILISRLFTPISQCLVLFTIYPVTILILFVIF